MRIELESWDKPLGKSEIKREMTIWARLIEHVLVVVTLVVICAIVWGISWLVEKGGPELSRMVLEPAGEMVHERAFQIAVTSFEEHDACREARVLAKGWLDQGDAAKYREWKALEQAWCTR
jgi:hypothetical protein